MNDTIKMRFPANKEYISAIRLAVSGIAGNMDFNIEEIEDLKSCIGEACILFLCSETCVGVDIEIKPAERFETSVAGVFSAVPKSSACPPEYNGEISRTMIEALSDDAEFYEENDILMKVIFHKEQMQNGQEMKQ